MHRFLAAMATVTCTCRLHDRYRVMGLWKVKTTVDRSVGPKMCWKGYRSRLGGRKV